MRCTLALLMSVLVKHGPTDLWLSCELSHNYNRRGRLVSMRGLQKLSCYPCCTLRAKSTQPLPLNFDHILTFLVSLQDFIALLEDQELWCL